MSTVWCFGRFWRKVLATVATVMRSVVHILCFSTFLTE